jgi:hypothetical protein
VIPPQVFERGNRAVADFLAYLDHLIARRRARPGHEHDVLTRLIHGEGDERLTDRELYHNCIFLLNAGHETTTNLIGNGLVALARFPQERERLVAQPELAKSAVEEILRLESSNQLGNRITVADAGVGGVAMAPQTQITLCIGAANRDPAQFPDPDRFDIGRNPNRHLAFATGVHACVGMPLARLEGTIALARFLARFPRYRLAQEPTRGARARFRGFLRIPATLD